MYLGLSLLSPKLSSFLIYLKGARRPTQNEAEVLLPAVQEVVKSCRFYKEISLSIIDDELDQSAMIIGDSILVSTGLLNNSGERELQAILACEIGHYVNGDSKFNIMIEFASQPMIIVSNMLNYVLEFVQKIPVVSLFFSLLMLIYWIPLSALSSILSLIERQVLKSNVYRADQYAVMHGFSDGLKSFLEQIRHLEQKKSFWSKMTDSSPSTSSRLLAIEKFTNSFNRFNQPQHGENF
ncbi:MAG: M48 family metalloprotease [Reichenbachiella sp.]|uniref:M48 family metalloprotease n=1 Tax=Reichenbachiella sp. TaxID=2184521 RepID=UPI00296778D0|nr:M48 family metalloprotease [Reichenbachiella sp.]MDW3209287.1 M48 family metalloprotease [Reichenbachiella sp.]